MAADPTKCGPAAERHLFEQISKLAAGFPTEVVSGAAINLLVSAVRQVYHDRTKAEARMRELYGKNMEILMMHYDPVTNRKRSIIPHDQVIIAPHLRFEDDLNG